LRTKREAQDWAARQEYLFGQTDGSRPTMTLGAAARKYELEILPKKTVRWNSPGAEIYALRLIMEDELAQKDVAAITPADLAAWRDRRLLSVAPSSAQRYMNTLSSILSVCVRDWALIDDNPMRKVRRPPPTPARKRRPTPEEIERMSVAGADVNTALGRAHLAFLFAIETGMRAGEIAGLTEESFDVERRVAHLARTKNGEARDVPLSRAALRILAKLPEADPLFGFHSGPNLSTNWYALKTKAAVEGLNFHDSRHEAVTRLSTKLDVLALARMIGHKNIKELMTYYNETAESLAARLD
jgi:integrase